MNENFSLLRTFTGAEGEVPCDTFGDALSPSCLKEFLRFGLPIWSLPLAWLEGKPVYPDSLICWDKGIPRRAGRFLGLGDPYWAGRFTWPAEAKKDSLGSADKYVREEGAEGCPCAFCTKFREEQSAPPAPSKTYNVVVLIDGEVHFQAKAAPGDVIATRIKSE